MVRKSLFALLAMAGLLVLCGGPALSQDTPKRIKVVPIRTGESHMVLGRELYTSYCAVCHGKEGKGDGPAAAALKKMPADLTRLAAAEGGKYPVYRVRQSIIGGASVTAHGTSEMPVWGPIFDSVGSNKSLGELRVANLVKFIEDMQVK